MVKSFIYSLVVYQSFASNTSPSMSLLRKRKFSLYGESKKSSRILQQNIKNSIHGPFRKWTDHAHFNKTTYKEILNNFFNIKNITAIFLNIRNSVLIKRIKNYVNNLEIMVVNCAKVCSKFRNEISIT